MASSVVIDGDGGTSSAVAQAPLRPISLAGLRRPWWLAAATLLVLAGALIGLLSSGSHPARAVVSPAPTFAGSVPAPSFASNLSFAGAVPGLAAPIRPRHRARPAAHHPQTPPHSAPAVSAPASTAAVVAAPAQPSYTPTVATSSPSTATTVHHSTTHSSPPAFGATGALGPGSSPSS